MPRTTEPPKYRRQCRPGRADDAFVQVNGRRRYLGPWGSEESRRQYALVIAEQRAGLPLTGSTQLTVSELVYAFQQYAESYYSKPGGEQTSEVEQFKLAVRPLLSLYGRTRACEFGPKRLTTVRQRMVDCDHSRQYINRQVNRIRLIFRWGTEAELVDPNVLHALRAVAPLKRGRTEARELPPVQPVPDNDIDATLPHLTPTLRAMVTLLRLTGMRPTEVCIMRPCDLDLSGDVWIYRPESHKTAYRGIERRVYFGPQAQEAVRPYLRRGPVGAFMFTPAQSEAERRERMHADRATPLSCGNLPGTNRKDDPQWQPGERYTADTLRRAIDYACRRAFPPPEGATGAALKQWRRDHHWSPGRLRHTYATMIRREHGLEEAQILLGHATAHVTQVYAERDEQKALTVARAIG